MELTLHILRSIMPVTDAHVVEQYVEPLTAALDVAAINTPLRVAAFLAQLAEESGELKYTKELSDGSQYEWRTKLGNTEPGDGPRYKGRGLFQVTGRNNYRECSVAICGDSDTLILNPELLEQPSYAAMSAGWYWGKNDLNPLADARDFEAITKRINGGLNGLATRLMYYKRALAILEVPSQEAP